MPKGRPLTDEERKEIYEARMAGESRAEIARAYGVAPTSVTAIVRKWREKENDMAAKNLIVSGNKKTGRLVSTTNPHRYEGTCVVSGKANSKTFTAENAAAATKQWEQWCDELRSKAEKREVSINTPVVKEDRPMVEEAKPIEHKEEVAKVVAVHKAEQPSSEVVYVIWTKGDKPRLYGAYSSMDAALRELDNLNEISSFLVNSRVFDIDEIPLKS